MVAEPLDLSLEGPGRHGDILTSNMDIVKGSCLRSGASVTTSVLTPICVHSHQSSIFPSNARTPAIPIHMRDDLAALTFELAPADLEAIEAL